MNTERSKPFQASTEVFDPTKASHRKMTVVGGRTVEPGKYRLALHPQDPDNRGGQTTRIFDLAGRTESIQQSYSDSDDLFRKMEQRAGDFIRYCQQQRSNLMIKKMSMQKLALDNPEVKNVVAQWQYDLINESLEKYKHLDESPVIAFQWNRYHEWGDRASMESGTMHSGYIDECRFQLFASVADVDRANEKIQPEDCRPYRDGPDNPQYIPKWVVV